ncbi:MAG: hypothetical protein ACOYEL_06250 [Saccharofermentanales bacterium]
MAKHFGILKKAAGYKIGNQVILCQIDQKMYLDQNLIAYPIGEI